MRLEAKLLSLGFAEENMRPVRVLGKRILLADDQQSVRIAIRHLLEVDQHCVTEARDGREAFECFRQGHFDLVIADYAMPKMPGSDLAIEIKRVAPKQPIIMISAYTPEQIPDNPVDAVLNKPFSFQVLRQTIASLLAES